MWESHLLHVNAADTSVPASSNDAQMIARVSFGSSSNQSSAMFEPRLKKTLLPRRARSGDCEGYCIDNLNFCVWFDLIGFL